MKLHEVPKGSKFKLTLVRDDKEAEEVVTFHKIDGMYSYLTADKDGAVCHLAAYVPVKKVGKFYRLEDE